ncbi:MAG: hypothetical protein KatS3mg113_0051 [Planctomycetaceae bacterium]|nr:MAG: hypothetical protein KatS3mg113_0051 [Planctomycetaceae bacterium]
MLRYVLLSGIGLYFTTICLAVEQMAEPTVLRPDYLHEHDPELTVPPAIYYLQPATVELWLEALQHSEQELRRLAAWSLAQACQRQLITRDAVIPALIRAIQRPENRPNTLAALADALISLQAEETADELWKLAQRQNYALRRIVEPALARWKYLPAQEVWQQRVEQYHPQVPSPTASEVQWALQGLAALQQTQAASNIENILMHRQVRDDVRRLAARTLAQLPAVDGLRLADQLLHLQNPPATIVERCCALELLANAPPHDAVPRLTRLLDDAVPLVSAKAFCELARQAPEIALTHLASQRLSTESVARLCALELMRTHPDEQRLEWLVTSLADTHREVREQAQRAIHSLADQTQWQVQLRLAVRRMLSGESPEGQEQAALLIAAWNDKEAVESLMKLQLSPVPRVRVAAAYSLRCLAVPETAPGLLSLAAELTRRRVAGEIDDSRAVDRHVAHLFEVLGTLRYHEAEPLLRQYIPKNQTLGEYSRCAAIWALGRLYEGRDDAALAAQLRGRLEDISSMPPEIEPVRRQCALTLGRMQARSQYDDLRRFLGDEVDPDPVEIALKWALEQINPVRLPDPQPRRIPVGNWFLTATPQP